MFKRISSIMFAILLITCPFILSACKKDKDNNPTPAPTTSSIEIVGEFKSTYLLNEVLDVSNIKVKVTLSDSSTTEIALTTEMVSGFDTTTVGDKTLTVTYDGKTATVNYRVVKSITSVTLLSGFKTEYFTGDALDVTGGKINVAYDDGTNEDITVTAEMLTGFDSTTAGLNKVLTLAYSGQTLTINYNVTQLVITKIEKLSSAELKSKYYVGDILDVTGGKIVATYNNGATEVVNITPEMVSGFDTLTAKSAAMVITYAGKTCEHTYSVEALVITNVTLESAFKTSYFVGEQLDVTGGTLKITYNSGKTEIQPITKSMILNFSTTTAGSKSLFITYNPKFAISLQYNVVAIVVSNIELVETFKTDYVIGEALDVTGGKIVITYNNGTITEPMNVTQSMIVENTFDTTQESTTLSMTLSYQNYSIQIPYTVTKITVESVTLSSGFTKTTYYKGESIDVSGAKIMVSYNRGEPEYFDVTTDMIINFSTNKVATEGKTASIRTNYYDEDLENFITINFTYYVYNKTITLSDGATLSCNVGDSLDFSDWKLTVTYFDANGEIESTEEIDVTEEMIVGYDSFDSSAAGQISLRLSYENLLTSWITYTINE